MLKSVSWAKTTILARARATECHLKWWDVGSSAESASHLGGFRHAPVGKI